MKILRHRLYRILEDDKTHHPEDRWCDAFLLTLIIVDTIAR